MLVRFIPCHGVFLGPRCNFAFGSRTIASSFVRKIIHCIPSRVRAQGLSVLGPSCFPGFRQKPFLCAELSRSSTSGSRLSSYLVEANRKKKNTDGPHNRSASLCEWRGRVKRLEQTAANQGYTSSKKSVAQLKTYVQ